MNSSCSARVQNKNQLPWLEALLQGGLPANCIIEMSYLGLLGQSADVFLTSWPHRLRVLQLSISSSNETSLLPFRALLLERL